METRGRDVGGECSYEIRKLGVKQKDSKADELDLTTESRELDGLLSRSGVMAGGLSRDRLLLFYDLQEKRRTEEELEGKYKERKQILQSLRQRSDELHKEVEKSRELYLRFHRFLKQKDGAARTLEKSERERKGMLQLEAELERLKVEYTELTGRKQELQRQLQRHSVYWDLMVQVVRITKFDDVQALMGHLENLLHFTERYYQRDIEVQEQVDQQEQALLALEAQHHLLQLQNKLSQLQTEMEETSSEVLTWERTWNHVQETADKKNLLLGQIKMVTRNLYELTDDIVEGEEAVDMNDTAKQLDKIKMFIQDYEGIVKHHQTPSLRHDGEKKDKTKPPKHALI